MRADHLPRASTAASRHVVVSSVFPPFMTAAVACTGNHFGAHHGNTRDHAIQLSVPSRPCQYDTAFALRIPLHQSQTAHTNQTNVKPRT